MGPLFSIVVAVIGLTGLAAVAFIVLRLFRRASALTLALAFSVGCFLGVAFAAAAAISVVGVEQALHSTTAVAAYLGSLCLAGLVGGGLSAHLASRVLTRRSSGRASGTPLT